MLCCLLIDIYHEELLPIIQRTSLLLVGAVHSYFTNILMQTTFTAGQHFCCWTSNSYFTEDQVPALVRRSSKPFIALALINVASYILFYTYRGYFERIVNSLKHLFPMTKPDTKHRLTFARQLLDIFC